MGVAVAALWGLAESTLFFIVPDVWLTRLALTRSLRYALLASLACAVGALLGGMVMLYWSWLDAASAQDMVEKLPAISSQMAATVRQQMANDDVMALLRGSFSGIPYKLYAVSVLGGGVPLWVFLLVTIPVRLVRFVLVVVTASVLGRSLQHRIGRQWTLRLWGVFWLVFYVLFWCLMPG